VSQRLLDPAQPVKGLGQFAVQLEHVEIRRRAGILIAHADCAFQDLGVCESRPTTGPANLPVETIKFVASHRDIITHPGARQGAGHDSWTDTYKVGANDDIHTRMLETSNP
jgi:hypothetical protein